MDKDEYLNIMLPIVDDIKLKFPWGEFSKFILLCERLSELWSAQEMSKTSFYTDGSEKDEYIARCADTFMGIATMANDYSDTFSYIKEKHGKKLDSLKEQMLKDL